MSRLGRLPLCGCWSLPALLAWVASCAVGVGRLLLLRPGKGVGRESTETVHLVAFGRGRYDPAPLRQARGGPRWEPGRLQESRMIQSLANWIKHLCYAVLFLLLLACLLEIGLRVHDSATGQVTRLDLYDRGLTCKSWLAHHELKPSRAYLVRHAETSRKVRVTVNSFGLRGAEPIVPKAPGTLRVLCLGDDSTFASHVAESETFVARLQDMLSQQRGQPVEVFNAGVPDYCPLLSYLQLRHRLLGLAPDLIVLCFDMSDISDDHAVRWFVVSDAEGHPTNCPHPGLEMPRQGNRRSVLDALLLPQWGRQRLNAFLADQTSRVASSSIDFPRSKYLWLADAPPDWEDAIEQTFSALDLIGELADQSGVRFVVTAIPAPWQVSATATTGGGARDRVGVPPDGLYRSRRPFELLADYCRQKGLEFVDVSPEFQSQGGGHRLFLKYVAEFSPEGHELFARELVRKMPGGGVLSDEGPDDYAEQDPGTAGVRRR